MPSKHNELKVDEEDDNSVVQLPGIPLAPHGQSSKNGVYFILEKASLVAAYVGKKYQILNPDEHASFLRRKNLNPYDYRPDIVHEALLQIMSSRLRMAGRLRAVFIRTDEGILIRVEPQTQIPKTLGSFCNMMAELLQKFSIKSKNGQGKLLRLIENPVTNHFPVNSRKIGLSFSSPKAVHLRDYASAINCNENVVFVVGAMAHGKIDVDYIDDLISVSAYPLSAGTCLRRICIALERNWKIQ
ncbi:ribosomal RNA small subunit methyltransferase nep-1-like isoform X1 [Abrus precatorius]|uniref:Ribosomal RNA small subunit methyltransferase nep-1-like isoform X1 n=1 Tax=Abrus precatorius TaxID=3816 RepID=A0A8B8M2K0_ABRPR|nr:ribosomal RNA small subunit methyltransferase nep-1-like isoform X1 [Abrus precatorius]XP_027361952.1 ribosomal RNA small subunit methyltransferase nep-1-like isoform X1 [Abrus precatorius]